MGCVSHTVESVMRHTPSATGERSQSGHAQVILHWFSSCSLRSSLLKSEGFVDPLLSLLQVSLTSRSIGSNQPFADTSNSGKPSIESFGLS